RYLEFTGRSPEQIELVEAYARAQGLWHDADSEAPTFSDTIELDLSEIEPSIAGPKRPQDRIPLADAQEAFRQALSGYVPEESDQDAAVAGTFPASDPTADQDPTNGLRALVDDRDAEPHPLRAGTT